MKRSVCLLVVLMAGSCWCLAAELPDGLRQNQPTFFVGVNVDHENRVYREGDQLSVGVVSERDAYLHVLYRQADGAVFQIFPNSAQTDNRIAAKVATKIPKPGSLFVWDVGPPFGVETVKVIATSKPLPALSSPDLRRELFNRLSKEVLDRAASALGGTDVGDWAEDEVDLVTISRDAPAPAAPKRRIGAFIGIAQYEFSEVLKAAGGRSLDLQFPPNDARQLSQTLSDFGELHSVRRLINHEASRAGIEELITRWLPAVSRPGDEVFISFSGHGAFLPDDNGDEADGLDEFLVPYDYLPFKALEQLLKWRDEGKLDARYQARLNDLAGRIGKFQTLEQFANKLDRETGITDDLFAHWLQRLAGRQVVVIIDACFSGGLATAEKGIKSAGARKFDFLDRELTRLKDIGQTGQSLLAACHKSQTALELPNFGMGVMTYMLTESVREGQPPLTIDQAANTCSTKMQAFFASAEFAALSRKNEEAFGGPLEPHQVLFINQCTRPIVLRVK